MPSARRVPMIRPPLPPIRRLKRLLMPRRSRIRRIGRISSNALGTEDESEFAAAPLKNIPPSAVAPSDAAEPVEKLAADVGDKTKSAEPIDKAEGQTGEVAPKEDWEANLPADTEEYIGKLPQNERQRARAAEKGSRMQQSFLNPNCPAEQWVANARGKSEMRFNQIADAILHERNAVSVEVAKTDPVKFLGELFDRTKDGDTSETYQNLLDTVVKTNPAYAAEVLKTQGYQLKPPSQIDDSADLTGADVENMSDAEIDEFESSEAYERLLEVYPDEAEKLKAILSNAKAERLAKTTTESARETAEREAATIAEKTAAAEAERKAQEEQTQARQVIAQTFETVYDAAITSHIGQRLDTELGLATTAEERESDPVFAFLKDAKKRLILAGGINGSGDFDNDLNEWGKTRPAFVQSADAMIAYARVGEKNNAEAAAAEMVPFADAFFLERLKMPEIAMIDEIMKDVALARQTKNRTRHDFVPDSYGSGSLGNRGAISQQDEFDNIKA